MRATGMLRIWKDGRKLTRDEERLQLTADEFALLEEARFNEVQGRLPPLSLSHSFSKLSCMYEMVR